MFRKILKAIFAIILLISVGCVLLYIILLQPPQRIVYKSAISKICVKVKIGSAESKCSDYTKDELRNSETVYVDEDYAFNEIVRMESGQDEVSN